MPIAMGYWFGDDFFINSSQQDLIQVLVVILVMGWRQTYIRSS
jgi:hypothetical protein